MEPVDRPDDALSQARREPCSSDVSSWVGEVEELFRLRGQRVCIELFRWWCSHSRSGTWGGYKAVGVPVLRLGGAVGCGRKS